MDGPDSSSRPSRNDEAAATGLSRPLTLVMAAGCGACVANIYYNQPMLVLLQRAFPGQTGLIDGVPTVTQLGYAAGLLLLVPLGDRLERRRLIAVQIGALTLALIALAVAPSAAMVLAASAAVGIAASVVQQIVPFAAELARPEHRGRVVGTVMSGVLVGLLVGRALGGAVGEHLGWRATFWVGALLTAATGAVLVALLPRREPRERATYGALMRSLGTLFATELELRRATAIQAMLFGSFIVLWTTLASHLQAQLNLGAQVAGLFGLVGVAGVLIAPVAGRVSDRRGPQAVIGLGAAVMLLAWLLFASWPGLAGLIAGVVLLDLGEQASIVSNQHIIYGLRPEARNRINTLFTCGMFFGGALGSWGATAAWHAGGWAAVAAFGAFLSLCALTLFAAGRRQTRRRLVTEELD